MVTSLNAFFEPIDTTYPTRADIDELFLVSKLPKRKPKHSNVFTVRQPLGMDIEGHLLVLIEYAGGEHDYAHQCGWCGNLVDEEYWQWHLRTTHGVA